MTCLSVALEEIKDLRKQLLAREDYVTKEPQGIKGVKCKTSTSSDVGSPVQDRNEWDLNDSVSTPGSVREITSHEH